MEFRERQKLNASCNETFQYCKAPRKWKSEPNAGIRWWRDVSTIDGELKFELIQQWVRFEKLPVFVKGFGCPKLLLFLFRY